jgi:hypothetical protein
MPVLWFVLPVFLAWFCLGIVAVVVQRSIPGKPARMIFGALSAVILIGTFSLGLYVFVEFIVNKGPDDWGALWHAGYPLAAKYGKSEDSSFSGKGFEKDPDNSGSGTYLTNFKYAGHTGVVHSHYNVTTHKFDHDEIVPDN